MSGILPLVPALAVVQEREEFDDEQVSTTCPGDRERVTSHPAPMIGAVMTRPIEHEAAAYLREKPATVIHVRVIFRVRAHNRSLLVRSGL
jgi:hypothetical protein